MNIKPTEDNILVEPLEKNLEPSGLYIPKESYGEPSKGIIRGLNAKNEDVFKINDNVFFRPEMTSDVIVDNKTWLLVRVSDILAIFSE